MFERKNQGILSEHYQKLVDHSADLEKLAPDGDENDDFIQIKRVDHALEDDFDQLQAENLSKRKLRAGESKRGMLKYGGTGSKLTFDEEGVGHEVYEFGDGDEFRRKDQALEAARKFAEAEREKMKITDVRDKAEAQEKKREKKRKRKEREVCR